MSEVMGIRENAKTIRGMFVKQNWFKEVLGKCYGYCLFLLLKHSTAEF